MSETSIEPIKFQSFSEDTSKDTVAPRVAALRAQLEAAGVDAFLLPRADVHRGEQVPDGEQRLSYITSFTGSAGQAVVGRKKAALFVDGRYTLQAPAQTDTDVFTLKQIPEDKLSDWIKSELPEQAVVAYDPWLHTPFEIDGLKKSLDGAAELKACDNLLDATWADRPEPPITPVEVIGQNRAGRTSDNKLEELRTTLTKHKADALVLNVPESINWLLNIRGRDIANTPVAHAFAIIPSTGRPNLFINQDKLDAAARAHIEQVADIQPQTDFAAAIESLGKSANLVWLDPHSAPDFVRTATKNAGAEVLQKSDPTHHAMTIKNEVELSGMREAHRRDGVAMAKFLHWFDVAIAKGSTLDEIQIATALEHFRRLDETLVDISFETISGAGPDGAIIHYRVTEATNRVLNAGELYLVDSGGQYLSGTTDITRTLWTGEVDVRLKDHFTRVLRGMINLTQAKFPKSTTGVQLDTLARNPLWQVGLNYQHGTGHGVGAFMGVHESPPGISPRSNNTFEPGMILSNEPGYYEEGSHGIRIENLIVVEPSPDAEDFLQFETITLAPIDTRLILVDQLSTTERDWLNAYHVRVYQEISSLLDDQDVVAWLKSATKPI